MPHCSRRNVVTEADTKIQHVDTINTLVPQQGHDDGTQGSKLTEQFSYDTQTQVVPHRSGRVVRQPNQYMFLGMSYDRIPDELNAESVNYNENTSRQRY